jgi:pilin isopeptide linkage protein
MVKTASFDLTGLTFEKVAAIYRYKVKEVAGSSDALTYDTAEFIVDLYVNNEGNVANIVARNAESEKAEIKFKNIYTTYGLEVSKTVAGAYGDKNKDFNFVLNVEASSTLIDDTVLKASKTLKDGSKEVVDITVGKDNSFTLKDGESLVVNDLPDGTKYTVSETDANKSGYNTVVNDSDNGVMDKDATVEFTNTKEAIVSTGVMLDSAPYILAFSMGVAVMILLVAKRKRNEA